jgi:N-glycosyltransferase
MFADTTTRRMVPDLLAIAEDWKPDLIVREAMEYGGCISAEYLDLPHASVAGNGLSTVDSPRVPYFTGNRLLVAEALAKHRAELGLAPDPDTEMPFRYLHLAFMPRGWSGEAPAPANTTHLRYTNPVVRREPLPDWVDDLPEGPLVLASLGTVFNKTPGMLEAIVEAAQAGAWNAIVSIGPDREAAEFGTQPRHVRIVEHIPQPSVLERCDAFITHAGFNSVKEALAAAVPMVAIPITADQPYCAERAAAIGAATVIGADERTPGAIGDAVAQVLSQPAYRGRARGFQAQMQALPGRDHMLGLLEDLAVSRRPVAR